MKFERLSIPDVILITPKKVGDARGYFMETFREELFQAQAGPVRFVQDNQSLSSEVGTIRGLHFQLAPYAQGKLVCCTGGALFDVAVDIRTGSPTYGQFVSANLSADNGQQLWIPTGFAHGFCTLMPNTVISYKVTEYYSPASDKGLLWNDPDIGINWPVVTGAAILSSKDLSQPRLNELPSAFSYGQE